MDSTTIVALGGLATTFAAAVVTARVQRRSQQEERIFQARLASYSDLAGALYDLERATYNRTKSRIEGLADGEREQYRRDAWASDSRARGAIGVISLLSSDPKMHVRFDALRDRIAAMNGIASVDALAVEHQQVVQKLQAELIDARQELARTIT